MFDTGSTVNILDYNTLVNHLEVPRQFIQTTSTGIRGITGQQVTNIGNVQLQTELLKHRSAESFVVLPDLTFPAQALIGYRTMKRWGLILDCKKEEVTLDSQAQHDCFQLEDETSPSNLINLTETTSMSGEHLHHTNSQENSVWEYAEQVNSVFSEPGRQPETQTQSLSEPTPAASTSRAEEANEEEEEGNEEDDDEE